MCASTSFTRKSQLYRPSIEYQGSIQRKELVTIFSDAFLFLSFLFLLRTIHPTQQSKQRRRIYQTAEHVRPFRVARSRAAGLKASHKSSRAGLRAKDIISQYELGAHRLMHSGR
ncbi:hypothetical protein EVAR_30050_1 [Eumeta japonica]|uniref:Uncharacterized protein n=1 Tax=Eumeta variegata TaxID=151549 RepID=A0A4C1VX48_EUMVA|nr:hypothetical protein EVAR_30050_1 [Eumeta japonica]